MLKSWMLRDFRRQNCPVLAKKQQMVGANLPQVPMSLSAMGEAVSALEALGYKYQQAFDTVQKLDHEQQDAQSLIKSALKILAKY